MSEVYNDQKLSLGGAGGGGNRACERTFKKIDFASTHPGHVVILAMIFSLSYYLVRNRFFLVILSCVFFFT